MHLLVEGFFLNAQALFWSRRAHDIIGPFDEELQHTMDYDLIMRLAGVARFLRVDVPLGSFRRHPAQKTQGGYDVVQREQLRVSQRLGASWRHGPGGRLLRYVFRVRRGWWYWRRGGAAYVLDRLGPPP